MKTKTRQAPRPSARTAPSPANAAANPLWRYAWPMAALLTVLWAYSPALHGPFVFDDEVWQLPGLTSPLSQWIRGGVRPVLYFTYWLNAHFSEADPFAYHLLNVLIHCVTGGLVFLIVRRLLQFAGVTVTANALAAFAAAIFLLHPVQTEAVAYVAGRSDSLSTLFTFGAFAVFLYRKNPAISWGNVGLILALFALGLLSKEQAIVLPVVFLLTDWWFNPGFSFEGVRRNWKLYAPMALGAVAGIAFFWSLITRATTAGFALKDFTWYQYFFTQCRALFVYLGMFLLPINLTLDWDFPVSHTLLERGAIFGLIGLLALAGAAFYFRRRFPLASYGFFLFLLLMAPTSSFLPIQDPIAERRLYASMLGLLLILVDFLRQLKPSRNAVAGVAVVIALIAAAATHARATTWGNPLLLWQDTVEKSPNKSRPHFHLGMAYFTSGRFEEAVAEFEKTAQLKPPDYNLLVDWGLALDAINRVDDALDKLRAAAAKEPTAHVYTQIAKVYAQRRMWNEALFALSIGEKIDGSYPPTYIYRGNVFFNSGNYRDAISEYEKALSFQPDNREAQQNRLKAQQLLRTQ